MRSIYVLAAFIGAGLATNKHHNISQEIDALQNSTIDESMFSNKTVFDRNMTKNTTSLFANKLNLAENKNKNLFDFVEKKL
jgi:hypothetical protein